MTRLAAAQVAYFKGKVQDFFSVTYRPCILRRKSVIQITFECDFLSGAVSTIAASIHPS